MFLDIVLHMKIDTFLRRTILIGIFATPFIPFLITKSMLFPFITGKNFAFRIIVEIIFAAWIFLAIRREEFRPKFSWLLAAVAVFVVIVGLADLFAVNPDKAFWSNYERMEGYITLLHLFMYFVVLSSVLNTARYWKWLFGTWVASSVIMCIYGLMQLGGKIVINQGGVRVDGTLGNATYLAAYLLFNIFFGIFLFLRSEKKEAVIWITSPVLFLQLAILYYTSTRGAILGLLGGVLIAVFLMAVLAKENKLARKVSVGILAAIILMTAGFIAIRQSVFVQSNPVLSRFASLSVGEIKSQGRYYIWPMAIKGWSEKPILGWGQDGFNYIFNKHYNPKMYNQEQWFDRAHSTPLDWLIAAGILGFASYFAIIFFSYFYIWKKESEFTTLEKSLLTGFLSAYVFQSLFVFDNLVSYLLLFVLLAFIHSSGERGFLKLPQFIGKLARPNASGAVSAILIIALASSFYFWNWKPIRASQSIIDALVALQTLGPTDKAIGNFEKVFLYQTFGSTEAREQMIPAANAFFQQTTPVEVREKFATLAIKELENQINETPQDARAHLFRGMFYRLVGRYDEALESLERARELSPRKQTIIFEIGTTYISMQEYEKAEAVFKEAFELEPAFGEAKFFYGLSLLYSGKAELAGQMLSSLKEDVLLKDDRLVGVLVNLGNWNDLVRIFSYRINSGADTLENNISLAVAYLRLGNRQASIDVLKRIAEKFPDQKAQMDQFMAEIEPGRDPSR